MITYNFISVANQLKIRKLNLVLRFSSGPRNGKCAFYHYFYYIVFVLST